MVFVKLVASHPNEYVKVVAGKNVYRVTKRGIEVPDEHASSFVGSALVVEGASVKKEEPVKEEKAQEKEEEKSSLSSKVSKVVSSAKEKVSSE